MSGVLIDTHVLLWVLFNDPRLSAPALQRIEAAEDVFVSVVSIYEIDFKRRDTDRLRARDHFLQRMPQDMPAALPSLGFKVLPIDAETAWLAARLPLDHGDPWDRILLAQAMRLGAPLISADQTLTAIANAQSSTAGVIVF